MLLAVAWLVLSLTAPTQPVAAQSPCRNTAIRSPFRGEVLAGRVPILGSARIDNFLFYKLEWAATEAPEQWSAVSTTIEAEVRNGLLDQLDTTRLPDGHYRLKLTVVDKDSQEICRVVVEDVEILNTVTATPDGSTTPTATPSPTAGQTAGWLNTTTPPTDTATPEPPTEIPTDPSTEAADEETATVEDAAESADGGDAAGTETSAAEAGPTATFAPATGSLVPAELAADFGIDSLMRAFAWSFAITFALALGAWLILRRAA